MRTVAPRTRNRRRYHIGAFAHYDAHFLLRDEFVTTEAADLTTPRAPEPGPGTLTVVDTDSKASIASAALHLEPHSTPAWGDPGVFGGALARACGRAMLTKVTPAAATYSMFGWHNAQAGQADYQTLRTAGDFKLDAYAGGASVAADIATFSAAAQEIAIVLRTTGGYYLRRTSGEWVLLWVDDTEATATLYPAISNYTSTLDVDYLRVTDLLSPWNTQYGLATFRDADAVAESTTFTHEADFVMRFEMDTLPAVGEKISIIIREQDATHNWRVEVDSDGDLDLVEDDAGDTTRVNAVQGLAGGEIITVIADDDTITLYDDAAQAGSYGSAANFKTETSGSLSSLGTNGVVKDLVIYPRTLSGAAKSALDRGAAL